MGERSLEEVLDALRDLLSSGDTARLRDLLSSIPSYELVEVLERLDVNERRKIVPYIQLRDIRDVMTKLHDDVISEIVRVKGLEEVSRVVSEMPSDEVADLLLKISPKLRSKLLALLPHWKLSEVSSLLKYPQESIGGLMTPQIPVFNHRSKIGEVLREYVVKNELGVYDKHYYVYAVDEEGRLVGWIDVRTLISQPREKMLKDVVAKPPTVLSVLADREEAARAAVKYDLLEIPAVDERGKLVGAVTLDDVVDVMVSEYTEDLLRFGGFIESLKGRYLAASPVTIVRMRLLPLMILYIVNSITGSIVSSFISVIERVAILAAFLPMLADNSGNVGSQASTFIIRSLVTGEVSIQDAAKILRKELAVVVLMSSLLAPVSFVIASAITFLAYGSLSKSFVVGIVVVVALITSTIIADLVGALLPLFLSLVRVDPAAASAPLVTTAADILTALMYFVIAGLLLGIL